MDEEIARHLEARVEHLVARGMSPAMARAEALRRFAADPTAARARLHRSAERRERLMARHEWIDGLRQDLRYAARGLLRRPGFTIVAVLTLAIGIGANTAIFSALNALLWRPLPFPDAARLMEVSLVSPGRADGPVTTRPGSIEGDRLMPWSWPKYVLYRDQQRSFRDAALWADVELNVTDGEPERVSGESVTPGYLATLGVRPLLGRGFSAEAGEPRGPRQVIISHALWGRRFNADPAILGRAIDIDREPFEVVGVTPGGFRGLSGRADLWITIRAAQDEASPWSLEFSQVARLAPGVTAQHASAEAAALGARIYEATPMAPGMIGATRGSWSATARLLDDTRVAPAVRRSLLVLFGAVGFVLLITCVNLANLLIGRASVRQREIAIRLSLGAARARLLRLLLTESVLLSVVGGVASVGVAWWGTRLLSSVNPASALRAQNLAGLGVVGFESIRLDVPALLFTLGVAVAVGLLFGLLPALQATRPGMHQLRSVDTTSQAAGRRRGLTSRRVLVVSEVALAIVLMSGAGLMLRSLDRLLHIDAGFDASNVLTLRLNVPPGQVPRDSLPGFYEGLLARLGALPGVTHAALGDCPPLSGGCNSTVLQRGDQPPGDPKGVPEIGVHWVTPGWFPALRVPLKRGRLFTGADRLGAAKVLLVSEAAARKYWPGEDPVGKQAAVFQGGFHTGATVIGVVGDVRYGTIDSLPVADAYLSYEQSPRPRMMIFLRTGNDPAALIPLARQVVRELSPSYPAFDAQALESRVAVASSQARLSAMLLGLFAAIALGLSVIGVYAVMAFAVVQRTREIGIRMALGADRRSVLRLVLGEGLQLAVTGAVIGVAAALGASRALAALLYDVSPSDPLTYVVIVVLLVAAAALASWLPARRAARVQPRDALAGP
jgi:predicted permease